MAEIPHSAFHIIYFPGLLIIILYFLVSEGNAAIKIGSAWVVRLFRQRVCLKDDGTGDGTLAIDCPGKDYRIGTLSVSKVNNIIYCKNDVLAE